MLEAEVQDNVAAPRSSARAVPVWRLYTLRLCYLILAGGLGAFVWPGVVHHSADFAVSRGVQVSLLAGLGACALLGLRYPVKMIPLLLFELTWKTIYLVGFALPLWKTHQITSAVEADISAVAMALVFLPLIPWSAVWRQYVREPGEPWR